METEVGKKFEHLIETKNQIKNAIIEKGQEVLDTDSFRSYADKIKAIQSGGSPQPSTPNKAAEIIQGTLTEYDDIDREIFLVASSIFANNSKLSYINFPVCSYIGRAAFSGCTNLHTALFEECLTVEDQVFHRCSSLSNAKFGVGATFGGRCFSGCTSLESIAIGSSLSNYLFNGCSKLKSIYFLNSYSDTIVYSSNALSNTPILVSSYLGGHYGSIYFPSTAIESFKTATNWVAISSRFAVLPEEYETKYIFGFEFANSDISEIPENKRLAERVLTSAFLSCSNLSSVDLPDCIDILDSAFTYCSALTTVSIPKCQNIKDYAFAYCSALTTMSIPKCQIIKDYAFMSCSALTSVYAPSCTKIGPAAFSGCTSLATFIGNNVVDISNWAFISAGLTSIDFPKCSIVDLQVFRSCVELSTANLPACKLVSGQGFSGCIKLESIHLPVCESIALNAFRDCYALSYVNLPKCSTLDRAFSGCTNLKTVIIGTELSEVVQLTTSLAFSNTPMMDGTNGYGSIYVKDDLVDAYKRDTNWIAVSDRITGISNLS